MTMTKVLLSIDSASFTGGLLDQVCQHHGVPLGDLVIVSSLQVTKIPGRTPLRAGQALEQGLLSPTAVMNACASFVYIFQLP